MKDKGKLYKILKSLGIDMRPAVTIRGGYKIAMNECDSIIKKYNFDTLKSGSLKSTLIAQDLVTHRNTVRKDLNEHTTKKLYPDKYESINQRLEEKYGESLGPDMDYFRRQGKSVDDIINSASRSGGKDIIQDEVNAKSEEISEAYDNVSSFNRDLQNPEIGNLFTDKDVLKKGIDYVEESSESYNKTNLPTWNRINSRGNKFNEEDVIDLKNISKQKEISFNKMVQQANKYKSGKDLELEGGINDNRLVADNLNYLDKNPEINRINWQEPPTPPITTTTTTTNTTTTTATTATATATTATATITVLATKRNKKDS